MALEKKYGHPPRNIGGSRLGCGGFFRALSFTAHRGLPHSDAHATLRLPGAHHLPVASRRLFGRHGPGMEALGFRHHCGSAQHSILAGALSLFRNRRDEYRRTRFLCLPCSHSRASSAQRRTHSGSSRFRPCSHIRRRNLRGAFIHIRQTENRFSKRPRRPTRTFPRAQLWRSSLRLATA